MRMEQTKIEVQDKDKTPDKEKGKEKPKQERTPLTEAERLRRQKMIGAACHGAGVPRCDVADFWPIV